MLSPRQQIIISREIRKEQLRQKAKPGFLRRPYKQVVAIGFSKARKIDPAIPEPDETELNNPVWS